MNVTFPSPWFSVTLLSLFGSGRPTTTRWRNNILISVDDFVAALYQNKKKEQKRLPFYFSRRSMACIIENDVGSVDVCSYGDTCTIALDASEAVFVDTAVGGIETVPFCLSSVETPLSNMSENYHKGRRKWRKGTIVHSIWYPGYESSEVVGLRNNVCQESSVMW